MSEFRLYTPDELGEDGYPLAWHGLGDQDSFALKRLVRTAAGHRCVRCQHPFLTKADARILGLPPTPGKWSPCDERCTHAGPIRFRPAGFSEDAEWVERDLDSIGLTAADARLDEGPTRLIVRYDVEALWRVLTVHHLDGEKANCRWWNLAALCQRCHLTIQDKVQMNEPWPWPHSDWMRPYVAGFYALRYLGEELPERPAEEKIAELLEIGRHEEAVERMAV